MSVVIPIYNPGPVLAKCLESVGRQTYPDLEMVPVDDAGPEPVRPALEALAAKDPRWKPVLHEKNMGLAASLNDGVRHCSGDLVLILEQDCEIVRPTAIEEAVVVAAAHPDWCLAGQVELPLAELGLSEVAFTLIWGHLPSDPALLPAPISFLELKCDLFPRQALEKVGGFDERFRLSGEDQMLSFNLRRLGYTIVRTAQLHHVLRFGRQTSAGGFLRKAYLYGLSQAGIVLRTRGVSLESTSANPESRARLTNRLHGLVGSVGLAAALIALILSAPAFVTFALLLPALTRMVAVCLRVRRLRGRPPHALGAATAAALLSPINDVVYAAGLAVGALRALTGRRS